MNADMPMDGVSRYRPIPIDPSAPAEVLLQKLWLTEGQHGPYSPELIPGIVDLGAAYFAEGEWKEAISTYNRAIHLQRLDAGLNTPDQTGLVEQVIEAHLQLGDYKAADGKQGYLFKIQSNVMSPNDPQMAQSVERYADWHRAAYHGQLDKVRYPRLLQLMDLYTDMVNASQDEAKGANRGMLPYLNGRLRTSYMLTLYTREDNDESISDLVRLRFSAYYGNNFREGLKSIDGMKAVLESVDDATARELADVEVKRGDWYMWFRQYALAIAAYENAWAMMTDQPGADAWRTANFGAPQELPKIKIMSQGLMPVSLYDKGNLHARFEVTRLGDAKGIAILSPTAEENQPAKTRGYKFVRNMRFRPRLENGKVVASSDVERIYSIRF